MGFPFIHKAITIITVGSFTSQSAESIFSGVFSSSPVALEVLVNGQLVKSQKALFFLEVYIILMTD